MFISMKKKIIIIGIPVLLIIVSVGVFVFSTFPQLPDKPSKEKLIEFFNQNKSVFSKIVTYFDSVDEEVEIDTRRGEDISTMSEPFVISDEVYGEVETLLYRYGFVGISESEKYIFFYKAWGFQWYQAIIYSKSDEEPPVNRIREYEKIEDNWYYYYGE